MRAVRGTVRKAVRVAVIDIHRTRQTLLMIVVTGQVAIVAMTSASAVTIATIQQPPMFMIEEWLLYHICSEQSRLRRLIESRR